MRRATRFLSILLASLALLVVAGYFLLAHTARKWFDADITRDECIMGAAACSPRVEVLAATESYPAEFRTDPCSCAISFT